MKFKSSKSIYSVLSIILIVWGVLSGYILVVITDETLTDINLKALALLCVTLLILTHLILKEIHFMEHCRYCYKKKTSRIKAYRIDKNREAAQIEIVALDVGTGAASVTSTEAEQQKNEAN